MQRRTFLASAAAFPPTGIKDQFPWAARQTYLNAAGLHPIPLAAAAAADRYNASRLRGPAAAHPPIDEPAIDRLRAQFAALLHASPNEIALVSSTQHGENIVAQTLNLASGKGNIVTDELHFHGSLYHYRMLAQSGLDVRIVPQKDWRIPFSSYEQAVDRNTRLIATSLISNINGFQHDAKKLSQLAHSHGAYLYCDVIQAAGILPLHLHDLGIDFCSAATYKWLMGFAGLGFLYVREQLLPKLRPPHFGDRQYKTFTYHNLPGSPSGPAPFTWDLHHSARKFELGHLNEAAIAAQLAALEYLQQLSVPAIAAHTLKLTQLARRRITALGYTPITPDESPAPIAAFLAPDMPAIEHKLARANVAAKVKWNQLRISPAVFNDEADIDRLVAALK